MADFIREILVKCFEKYATLLDYCHRFEIWILKVF